MCAKVMLAMAVKDSIYTECVRSMLAIQFELMSNGHGFIIAINSQDSLITRARDKLAQDFLDEPKTKDFTHLLFMDSDIHISQPNAILKLLESDKDIIAGIYRVKSDTDIRPAIIPLDTSKQSIEHYRVPVECTYVATGFLLIKREVLEGLQGKVPKYHIAEQTISQLFPSYMINLNVPDKGIRPILLSEDWCFSRICRENGYHVWGLDVGLIHIGLKGYAFEK
jgi:hypothetical protein